MTTGPVKLIRTRRFGDQRGWFCETYSARVYAKAGIAVDFVQDNHSYSSQAGTLRGFHFQIPPHAQDKLVRCVRGRILDVAVDLRKGSPSYGHWASAELSAANGMQLFIPIGFGHALVTLDPDTEVIYKVSDFYSPECDRGVRWNDGDIGVDWPIPPQGPTLSAKDTQHPMLRDFDSPFGYVNSPLVPLKAIEI